MPGKYYIYPNKACIAWLTCRLERLWSLDTNPNPCPPPVHISSISRWPFHTNVMWPAPRPEASPGSSSSGRAPSTSSSTGNLSFSSRHSFCFPWYTDSSSLKIRKSKTMMQHFLFRFFSVFFILISGMKCPWLSSKVTGYKRILNMKFHQNWSRPEVVNEIHLAFVRRRWTKSIDVLMRVTSLWLFYMWTTWKKMVTLLGRDITTGIQTQGR